jgi:hypothetical protein
MTIAAGFYFNGGIVLCADTQETVGASKTWTPKLIVEPNDMLGKDSRDSLMIAIAGAGDGPWTDKIVERAWADVKSSASFGEACSNMETSIKETYREYGEIFQPGYLPSADLVYGVKMQGQSRLFLASGAIVNEKRGYAAVGIGQYLADFVASRVHQRYLPGSWVLMLAAYVIFQCKEYVDGCGGDTHIAILSEGGNSNRLDPWRTDFATEQLRRMDNVVSTLLLSASDFSAKEEDFKNELDGAIAAIREVRRSGEQFSKAWEEFTKSRFKAVGFDKPEP